MSSFKNIEPNLWPKGNYDPVAHINLESDYFKDKFGFHFFIDCDDLGECEMCLINLVEGSKNFFFSLFKYCGVGEGLDVLMDNSLLSDSESLEIIVRSLGVDSKLVSYPIL